MPDSLERGKMERRALSVETLRATHAAELYPLLQAQALYRFIPGQPPSQVEEVEARFKRLEAGSANHDEVWLNWVARIEGKAVATLQSTLRAQGHALIGYVVFEPFWNQGIGTLCVAWILRELFEQHDVQTAHADIDPRNVASLRIVQKLGMKEVTSAMTRDAAADRELELSRAQWLALNAQPIRSDTDSADKG